MRESNFVESSRLLQRCTFGPSLDDIEHFQSFDSIHDWVVDQSKKPVSSWLDKYEQIESNTPTPSPGQCFASSWTEMTMSSSKEIDALRQRVAYILSELFVVSTQDPALQPMARRRYLCQYYDGLAANALGNFRDLLKWVSTSPIMGEYLTFVNNVSDANSAPDENYARELLQLFTLGPTTLNGNGDVEKDEFGRPIPAYAQTDIEELARVFTGWTFANSSTTIERYGKPLVSVESNHDRGEKRILGKSFPANVDAEDELNDVIEHLMNQSNLYTFVSKFFITKMVTSNPRPAYIRRVRNAFKNSDGDMKTLILAILEDQTALNSTSTDGKVRDPMCVFVHAMRALKTQLAHGEAIWPAAFNWYDRLLPMSAPSVFYYYQPDDSPSTPDFVNLYAPEFNVYTWQDIYKYGHILRNLLTIQQEQERGWFIDSEYFSLYLTKNEEGNWDDKSLIEHLNTHLFAGSLSTHAQDAFYEYLSHCTNRNESSYNHIRNLIMHALLSPEFVIQD
ncbi:DUF1800 family protein [Vibrio astriarenae]